MFAALTGEIISNQLIRKEQFYCTISDCCQIQIYEKYIPCSTVYNKFDCKARLSDPLSHSDTPPSSSRQEERIQVSLGCTVHHLACTAQPREHTGMGQVFTLVTLISAMCDVIIACNYELARFSQISACDFVKLSDVMGFSKGVQKHLARWISITNECR